jgi:O-succinylbenzoate synthase
MMPMQLTGVELVTVDVPFRQAIDTAMGSHRTRSVLFVRVVGDLGEGWGECAALGEATSVDPAVAEVAAAAAARGIERLGHAVAARGGQMPAARDVALLFGSSSVDRMLGAAFEMAVLDAELRQAGLSMAQSLDVGAGFEALPSGAAVGIPPGHDISHLRQMVSDAVSAGSARVRLKIAPGWDLNAVAAVREDHPDLVVQVDANGSYRPEDAEHLDRLFDLGVLCIEQPLPPADLVAQAQLAARLRLPICLDESLSAPRRVQDAIRNRACAMACLKPGRLGGIWATRRAHASCVEAGVAVFVGGFFETGLGRSANLALAARLAEDAPGLVGDVGNPIDYLEVDPCGYPHVHNGWVRVPDQPGVGSWPDELTLADLGALRRWFPATYT